MEDGTTALFTELHRGARAILDNAEALCQEAHLLREHGLLPRALLLHQISLEECGKFEILGEWATTALLGDKIDIVKMQASFRNHKAKNYANAYSAALLPEEREAIERGDHGTAMRAFAELQERFHRDANAAKNAALYVDYIEGVFETPKGRITEKVVGGFAAVNLYFLERTRPKVRLFERMAQDHVVLKEAAQWIVGRAEALRSSEHGVSIAAIEGLLREVVAKYARS